MTLEKIKTKNILADWEKLKCQEKVFQNCQWTDNEIQLLLEATQNLKVEEYYKKITKNIPDQV